MECFGLTADYDIINDVSHGGRPAAAHMLLAHAGAAEFNQGAGNPVPDTNQFFDLVDCSARVPGRRWMATWNASPSRQRTHG